MSELSASQQTILGKVREYIRAASKEDYADDPYAFLVASGTQLNIKLKAPRHDRFYVCVSDVSTICFFGEDGMIYWQGYDPHGSLASNTLAEGWTVAPLVDEAGILGEEALWVTTMLNRINSSPVPLVIEVPIEAEQMDRLFRGNLPDAMKAALVQDQATSCGRVRWSS